MKSMKRRKRNMLFILSALALVLAAVIFWPEDKDIEKRVMKNREKYIEILRSTGRPGLDEVIYHLDSLGFFTFPGGSGHHTGKGGLTEHSLEVFRIMRCLSWFQSYDSIVMVGLFHDMGKIEEGWHPHRSVKLLGEWGFSLTEREYNVILRHHRHGLRYYRSHLRRSLTIADYLSGGWWKLRHLRQKKTIPDHIYD